ncbi:MAG: Gfo/Idh/MocA family oxidoreductase [Acidimicrobiales bacterium]
MIRYGVIGTGMMGVEHIENILAIDGAVVTAIADPVEASRVQGLAAAAPSGSEVVAFEGHRELLASGLVDAVVVVTPNHTHIDVMHDVLDAGVHVMCEKPLCTTVEDVQSLIAKAEATGGTDGARKVWVGLEYRYMPAVAELVDDVRSGTVGTPKMVAIREHRFPFLVKVGNWNRFSANTGGTLVEKCCHFFDLMNLVLDERPSRVMASGAQDVNHLDEVYDGRRSDILDNAFVIVDYPSGARALLDLCMFAEATNSQEEISVVGDRGKLEANLPQGVIRTGIRGEHWIGKVDERHADESHVAYEGLHHGSSYVEHLRFFAAIKGENPIEVTLDDGLWSVAMGVAAHRSIESGRPILMSEVL